ncbi:MAG: OB-fold domain-containing protein [Gammaproteobacteria bacterium]
MSESLLKPPAARSPAALGLTAAAAAGRFELQVCANCSTVQYPPREACVHCLTGALEWREQSGLGELIAATTVHHSADPYFRAQGPWRIGMVRLDAGVTVITHLHHACAETRGRVQVRALLDRAEQGVLMAFPADPAQAGTPDPQVLEMTGKGLYQR